MGFKSVYRTLQELFPQVDARLLRAAAIEHPKDPDEAVGFILTVGIPHTMEKFDASSAVNDTVGSSVDCERQCSSTSASSSKNEAYAVCEYAIGSKLKEIPYYIDPPYLNEGVQDPLGLTFYDANAGSEESTTSKTWGKTLQEISSFPALGDIDKEDSTRHLKHNAFSNASELQKFLDLILSASSTSSLPEDIVSDVSVNNKSNHNCGSDFDPLYFHLNVAVHDENIRKQPNFDSDSMYGSNHVELPFLSAKDHTVESLDCSIQANVKSVTTELKLEIPGHGCIDDTAFREDIQGLDHANTGELSCLHSIITQSGQVCNTDLLENILEQATDHKKSLHSDMESVINLMKEVEIQENAADQAMKEVGEGGLEVHAKVKELKTMLNRAREANDMHSGEVYGERTILGTEMKELQSRVLALSDVKKKFHSILDVMQRTLEKRLAAAETERISAEQEKYEREESEQKALAEQELIMEKVVQESKILQQEAEENARLREFLVDHGRVVDMLQGEMSVICEDIMLLKEKLDKGIPLSQSVSSEQTSFMVASSGCGSGRKSTDSERLLKHDQDISSVEPLLLGSTDDLTTAFPRNEVLDDGWELFELEDVTR